MPDRRATSPARPAAGRRRHIRRTITVAVAAIAATAVLASPAPVGATDPNVDPQLSVQQWVQGVSVPWDISFTPDGHALIPERDTADIVVRTPNGAVRRIAANTADVNSSGEGGLLGLVVDPDFDRNRRFYTCQTTSSAVEVVSWRMNDGYTAATRVKDPLVGGIDRTSGRHSGCRLRFGHQGYLWIATGDAARGTTPQDLRSLAGKVLRVVPETGKAAPGNPFIGRPGADNRIYSYGHRNPQGLDRRPCTSQMWTGEHGPNVNDEINLIAPGGNYGWDPVPGYNEGVPMTDFGLPGPQRGAKWASGGRTVALSGIGWIRGASWGAWDGELAGATLKDSRLMVFEFRNNSSLADVDIPPELDRVWGRLRTAVMGPDGALYVTTDNAGVLRVRPDDPGPTPSDQDIDGDGRDDLVVGSPGEGGDAGGFNALYGRAGGLSGRGSEYRTQADIRGAAPQAGDGTGSAVAYGDIDGDGLTDVVVGSPGERVKNQARAGAIHVICGRTNGVESRSSQTFSQAGTVAGVPDVGDRFGAALALGDFDGDGYDDVASGAPGEDVAGRNGAGAVTIINGTSAGLTTERSRVWSQQGAVVGLVRAGDGFGTALVAADFNRDGYDDLAIGVPGKDVAGARNSGAVVVLYGSPTGLDADGSQIWHQRNGVPSDNGPGDALGSTLAAGDFDRDGRVDLAIGAPGENVNGRNDAGGVGVLFGSASGLRTAGATMITQSATGDTPNAGDRMGAALATGDTDGDGDDDLAIGSPGENGNRGRVFVFDGGTGGLRFDRSFSAAGSVPGNDEAGDRLGASLRMADFDGNGRADLAIGVPGEDLAGAVDAGAIVVLQGSPSGLTTSGSRVINQNTPGVGNSTSPGDGWGSAM